MHRLKAALAIYFSSSRFVLYLKKEACVINFQGPLKTQRRNLSTHENFPKLSKVICIEFIFDSVCNLFFP